ncbi:hypothetical protein KY360_05385 [Candidatus Woesearchaeota archaeon]|nr:hypothetical protein [Candidatus Woesearchaeota archaeon]
MIAIFLCTLIITIPFYTSSVYAAVSGHIKRYPVAYGNSDGFPGAARQYDTITVEALARIDVDGESQPVSANQVKLYNEGMDFDYCDPDAGGYYLCSLENYPYPTGGFQGIKKFDIGLYHEGTRIAVGRASVVPDFKPPRIESLAITLPSEDAVKGISTTGTVSVDYIVKDYGYLNSWRDKECSGISKVEFYLNGFTGGPFKTENIDTGDCDYSDSFSFNVPSNIMVGTVKVCAKVYDRFNQASSEEEASPNCVSFGIDREGPGIQGGSFRVVDEDDRDVYFYHPRGKDVDVVFVIDAEDLNLGQGLGSIRIDLTTLDSSKLTSSNLNSGQCLRAPNSNLTNCVVSINLDSEGGLVTITSTDRYDNVDEEFLTAIFTLDETGPIVAQFVSDSIFMDGLYAKQYGNNFSALISDGGGIGVDSDDVKLVFYDGFSYDSSQDLNVVTNCTGTPGATACLWEGVDLSPGSDMAVKARIEGNDMLENAIAANEFNVTVDITPPLVTEADISIEALGSLTGDLTSGGGINITARIKDFTQIFAHADLSRFITGGERVPADSCIKVSDEWADETEWVCSWLRMIEAPGPDSGIDMDIEFEDVPGNIVTVTKTGLELYERVVEEVPDYYDLDIREDLLELIPIDMEVIESLTTQFYYQLVPFELLYNGRCSGDEIEITNIRLFGCEGYAYHAPRSDDPRSYTGFIQFALDTNEIINYDDYVEIGVDSTCQIEFNVKCHQKSYLQPEPEEIRLNIPIVVGDDVGDDLTDDIEDLKDWAETDFWAMWEFMDQVVTILKNICKIRQHIYLIATTIALIGAIFANCCEKGAAASAYCCPAEITSSGIHITFTEPQEAGAPGTTFEDKMKKLCAFVGCQKKDEPGLRAEDLPSDTAGAGDDAPDPTPRELLCNKLAKLGKNWITEYDFGSSGAAQGAETYVDAAWSTSVLQLSMKSLIFASICLCLPGIVYNVRKYRELVCWKAICYRDLVTLGLPKDECDKQYEYHMCVYVLGDAIGWLLFNFIGAAIQAIVQMLINPVAALWAWTRTGLLRKCHTSLSKTVKWSTWCAAYAVWQLLTNIAEIAELEETYENMKWDHETNMCEELLDD